MGIDLREGVGTQARQCVVWGLRGDVGPESGGGQLTPLSCSLSSLKTRLHLSIRNRILAQWPAQASGPAFATPWPGALALGWTCTSWSTHPVAAGSGRGGWVGWWGGLQTCLASPLRAPWSFPSPSPLRSPFPSSPSLLPCPVPAPPSPPPLAIRAATAGPDPPGSARPLAEQPPPPRLLRRRSPTGVRGAGHKTGQSRRPGH